MPNQTPVSLSFIIPVKNDAYRLGRCLQSILLNRQSRCRVEVLVADNGSTDGTPGVAASAGVTVLSLPGLRVSELRNRAAKLATGEVLAFVDADHEIVATWVASAIDLLSDQTVGAAGAAYTAPAGGSWVQRAYGALRGRTHGRHDVAWLGSGNLAARRSAFEAIGGFDPSLEACEDVDFCQRLRSRGWRIMADERLGSTHLGDPATLGALFRAERWRGRNNIRVSLRGPITLRDIPSVIIPIINLASLAVILFGLIVVPVAGSPALLAALAGAIVIAGLTSLRTLRIVSNSRLRNPLAWGQAFVVSLTYDVARAVALMTRAPHHRHASSQASAPGMPPGAPQP